MSLVGFKSAPNLNSARNEDGRLSQKVCTSSEFGELLTRCEHSIDVKLRVDVGGGRADR